MNRYKYLFKNIGLLTLSNFATKLLSFFLVPLYTNILATTEYGIYDLFATTIGVLIPILTLNIQESVMRFALDNKYSRRSIVTIGFKYLLISNTIVLVILGLNMLVGVSDIVETYSIFFFFMFLSQSLSGIVTAYVRGIDSIAELSVSSVVASFVTICCNILFLVIFRWGLEGYFLANILGPLMQSVYLIIKTHIINEINLKDKFKNEKDAMMIYCKPLIANSLAWWVNNMSDRYIVIFFCGLAENGIYSVASKIPSILNVFQSIFSQAWTLSAVRDFDPEDKSGFFGNTYKIYNCMLVVICSAIIVLDKILAKILYAKDFYMAYEYVPWLTIAIVFGAMSGYIGGFFSAVKNSKIFAQSSLVGAISNIIMNLILTPLIGPMGAAIATAVSYFEVWAIRYKHSKRFVKMEINLSRDIISYGILGVQAIIIWGIKQNIIFYIVEILLFVFITILYAKDIFMVVNKGKNSILNKEKR